MRLTPTEFDLLKELAVAGGRPLTHQMLLRTVWGPGYADEMHLLRVNMGRLRDKLQAEGVQRDAIETLTGRRLPPARLTAASRLHHGGVTDRRRRAPDG